jgi:hypothetical protein
VLRWLAISLIEFGGAQPRSVEEADIVETEITIDIG